MIDELALATHGAERFNRALAAADLAGLLGLLAGQRPDQAGVRLFDVEGLGAWLAIDGPVGRIAASVMGGPIRPVRALLFDKSAAANWSLAWHQDRAIAVRERRDVEGFGPWTRKRGALHVAPPPDLLARMRTLRVHLDPATATNAPLLIVPGSHRFGRISEADVPGIVDRCGVTSCFAEPGDIWAYATPILHASERAAQPTLRRVLQVDYAAEELPGGLEWLGV